MSVAHGACDEVWKLNKGRNSRFIRPFDILSHMREVAYKLVIPHSWSVVHPLFYISMLQKYVSNESHIRSPDSIELGLDLYFEEEYIVILDRHVQKLRTKKIVSVKVYWKHHSVSRRLGKRSR